MNSIDTKTTSVASNWDVKIFEATRAVLNAETADERKQAEKVLYDLKYERNVERYPLRTEVRDGEVHILVPDDLSGVRFNSFDMEIFVKRAIAFRKASGI